MGRRVPIILMRDSEIARQVIGIDGTTYVNSILCGVGELLVEGSSKAEICEHECLRQTHPPKRDNETKNGTNEENKLQEKLTSRSNTVVLLASSASP